VNDIGRPDIAAAAKAISSKSLSSAELTERTLHRIALVDPHLRAYVEVLPL
jgi:Asp-tRNA(Asn)/Glu-tRNA(Gln) amidotransferase A subunit family amidase